MGEDSLHVGEMFAGVGGGFLPRPRRTSVQRDWETEFLQVRRYRIRGSLEQPVGAVAATSNGLQKSTKKGLVMKGIQTMISTILHSTKERWSKLFVNKFLDLDILVGGFPCQDYSVARTVSGELGIEGEKGKLWIPIRNIIRHKRPRPKVVLLENVPRLLNSPANARGLKLRYNSQRPHLDGIRSRMESHQRCRLWYAPATAVV